VLEIHKVRKITVAGKAIDVAVAEADTVESSAN
jgi:hypothetical protein